MAGPRAMELVLSAKVDASLERVVEKATKASAAVKDIGKVAEGGFIGVPPRIIERMQARERVQEEADRRREARAMQKLAPGNTGLLHGPTSLEIAAANEKEEIRVGRMIQQSQNLGDSLMRKAQGIRDQHASQAADLIRMHGPTSLEIAAANEKERRQQRQLERAYSGLGGRGGGGDDGDGGGGGRRSALNLFGRRSRLIGPGGFNDFGLVARLGMGLESIPGVGVAAASALAAFTAAVMTATSTLGQLGASGRLGGGTAGEVAAANVLGYGGASGAGAAGALRARIAPGGNPFAMLAASSMGISAIPEQFSPHDQDNTKYVAQVFKGLKETVDPQERIWKARQLEVTEMLALLDTSPRLQAIMERRMTIEERLANSPATQAANELEQATKQLGGAWADLITVIGAPVIRGLADTFESITESVLEMTDRLHGKDPAQDEQLKAIKEHTAALNRNTASQDKTTEAMKEMIPLGDYGSAASGRAAPGGWSGAFLNRNMEQHALSRGLPGV